MYKFQIILISALVFLAQQSFANTMMSSPNDEDISKPCKKIATACKNAGFSKKGENGKAIWFDCMKPVIMNKTVKGVTVDAKDVQACREDKIQRLQKDLEDFQSVK